MVSISVSGIGSAAPTRASAILSKRMRRLACVSGAGAAVLLALPGAVATSELSVDLVNLRAHKGSVRICLTADPDNFPACIDDAQAVTRSIPATAATLSFAGLAHGDYA